MLAVKPQVAAEAVPAVVPHLGDAVVLSIMAGKTLRSLAGLVGAEAAVVRAMPNTPAAVRQGITVAVAGPGVDGERRRCAMRCWRRSARSSGWRTRGCSTR